MVIVLNGALKTDPAGKSFGQVLNHFWTQEGSLCWEFGVALWLGLCEGKIIPDK